MLPVSSAELALIRSDLVAAVCDKTCVVWRGTATTDTSGNAVVGSYASINTTVAGMRQPTAGQLQNYDYRIGSLAAWLVMLPYGTDVRVNDWLVIESQTLYVHVLLDPHSYPGLLPVLVAEMK